MDSEARELLALVLDADWSAHCQECAVVATHSPLRARIERFLGREVTPIDPPP